MKFVAAAAFVAGLTLAGAASAGTVVFSEDFEGYDVSGLARNSTGASSSGGTSFTTEYGFRSGTPNNSGSPDSMYDEGTWTIGTNPNAVHDLWVPVQGDNQMLILNGRNNTTVENPAVAWKSNTFNVGAGHFDFSFDLMNVCCANYTGVSSNLWFDYAEDGVNFTRILTQMDAPTTPGVFQTYTGSFDLANGGAMRISFVDSQGQAAGNDFGLDNIKVTAVPEPTTWALMILGFGAVGAMARRRQYALAQ